MFDSLVEETARGLVAAYDADSNEPTLQFPILRSGRRRVSEQEARVVMCLALEGKHPYSIEYPTTMLHKFSGKIPLSARIDLVVRTVHGPALAVEFKAGQPPQPAIDKDMVKLVGEGVHGLWFHTLGAANSATLTSVFGKLKAGLISGRRTWSADGLTANPSVDRHAIPDHELTLAVVVLSGPDKGLWTQQVRITQDIGDQRADWIHQPM